MTGRLRDRVAIITGADDGIGAGVARRFAAEGARVLAAGVDDGKGRAVAEEIGGRFEHTDVTSREQVEAMVAAAVDTWGRVDVLVNNAWGAGNVGRVENKTDEMLERASHLGVQLREGGAPGADPHRRA